MRSHAVAFASGAGQPLRCGAVPVEVLSDEEEADAYGRFAGVPSRADLEMTFFVDDVDKELIAKKQFGWGDRRRRGGGGAFEGGAPVSERVAWW